MKAKIRPVNLPGPPKYEGKTGKAIPSEHKAHREHIKSEPYEVPRDGSKGYFDQMRLEYVPPMDTVRKVQELYALGFSLTWIARSLGISVPTARKYKGYYEGTHFKTKPHRLSGGGEDGDAGNGTKA